MNSNIGLLCGGLGILVFFGVGVAALILGIRNRKKGEASNLWPSVEGIITDARISATPRCRRSEKQTGAVCSPSPRGRSRRTSRPSGGASKRKRPARPRKSWTNFQSTAGSRSIMTLKNRTRQFWFLAQKVPSWESLSASSSY